MTDNPPNCHFEFELAPSQRGALQSTGGKKIYNYIYIYITIYMAISITIYIYITIYIFMIIYHYQISVFVPDPTTWQRSTHHWSVQLSCSEMTASWFFERQLATCSVYSLTWGFPMDGLQWKIHL